MTKRPNKIGGYVAVLLAGAAWPNLATAQSASDAPAAEEAGESVSSGEIIVTARKRSERVLDVPTSITAIGETELARYASSNFEAIGSQVPQVTITHNPNGAGAVVTIRGIGTNNTGDDGVEQAVSFNVDGVPTSRGRILQQAIFDLDNVQVLKGPQALYFGKNSPGGVLIAESKGPTARLSGYVRAGYEFKAREYIGEAAIGGPISDSVGFRIAVRGSDMRAGYIRNVAAPILAVNSPIASDRINGIDLPGASYKWGPGTKQYAGRLTLSFDNDGPFKATFKAFGSYYKTNGETSQVLQLSCPAGFPRGAIRDLGALGFGLPIGIAQDPNGVCDPSRRRNTIGSLPVALSNFPDLNGGVPFSNTKNYLGSLKLEYQAGEVNFTSITGYYEYTNRYFANFDYTTFNILHGTSLSTNKSWTQELRAVSSFGGPLNFSIGAFYQDDKRGYINANTIFRNNAVATGTSIVYRGESDTDGSAYSVVGELTYKPIEEVEISGGARYTNEEKKSFLITTLRAPGLAAALGAYSPAGQSISPRFKAENVSPQVTASWRPSSNTNLFIGYRTGFKSGGIASPGLIAPSATNQTLVFDNETVKGVEGGFKFQTDDRKLRGDITAYHYRYKGLQVSSYDATANVLRIQNAGGANVDGVEGSINYQATEAFSVHGSIGYNRARFTTFMNAACYAGQVVATGCSANPPQQNLTGRRLPRAPDFSGSAGIVWDQEIADGMRLGATVDGRFSSKYSIDTTLSPFGVQKTYALLDASLRLRGSDDGWEVALIGQNLTNKFYATYGTDRPIGVAPGSITGVSGLPRTVQLQGTFNF